MVWPSYILSLALDSQEPPPVSLTVFIVSLAVAVNVVLYGLLASFFGGTWRLVRSRRLVWAGIVCSMGAALVAGWVRFALLL